MWLKWRPNQHETPQHIRITHRYVSREFPDVFRVLQGPEGDFSQVSDSVQQLVAGFFKVKRQKEFI